MRNIKYGFKGLDLRTNELYRVDGTASDCRNVYLDPHRRLVKRPDFDTITLDRGILDEEDTFYTKLPFHAVIQAIITYEDHKVIVVRTKTADLVAYKYVTQYYKWFEETNTLEFIPVSMATVVEAKTGTFAYREEYNMKGRIQHLIQEGILYFRGDVDVADNPTNDGSVTPVEIEHNRSLLFKYDGVNIYVAGTEQVAQTATSDQGTQTTADYLKFLPFRLDAKNRPTFGNTTGYGGIYNGGTQVVDIDLKPHLGIYEQYRKRSAYVGISTTVSLLESDSLATRTIPVTFFEDSEGVSVSVGQKLFSIVQLNAFFFSEASTGFTIYRFEVEAFDKDLGTISVKDFEVYNTSNGLFEVSTSLEINHDQPTIPAFLSNTIQAIYGSQDFAFGYKFKGFTYWIDIDSVEYDSTYLSLDIPGSTYTKVEIDPTFLFLTERLEDMYDEDTVKFPPPKLKDFSTHLTGMVVNDEDNIYFSDFSVGGNIETYTPFDTFKVGSTEFGNITGIFANETFLAVFREEETYHITGNIFLLNYRVQSYKSTLIGCTDPSSINSYKGSGIFVSNKGIYICAQGGRMEEVSDIIEPLFFSDILGLQLDLFDVKTVIDSQKELIIFDFASKLEANLNYQVVYSYYHNEWFIFEGIPTSGGLAIIDNLIYTSDGTSIFKEASTSENSVAYYRSNFESIKTPSLPKRFIKMWISTIGMAADFALGVKSYKNWNTEEVITDEEKSGDSTTLDVVQNFNQGTRTRSVAMEIFSDTGSPLVVEGYEYQVEGGSKEVKHNDL